MQNISRQQRSQMQDTILDLAMHCPVEQCNPETCPLYHVRQIALPERLQWFKSLPDEDLIYLNTYHFICMKTKLEASGAVAAGMA